MFDRVIALVFDKKMSGGLGWGLRYNVASHGDGAYGALLFLSDGFVFLVNFNI